MSEDKIQKMIERSKPKTGLTVTLFPGAVVDTVDGAAIARSRQAVMVKAGRKPAILLIPKSEILEGVLSPTATRTEDPDFGEAQHYDIQGATMAYKDAARSFVDPQGEAARLKDCVTFDLKAVAIRQERRRGRANGADEGVLL